MDGINIQDNTLKSTDGVFNTVQPRVDAIKTKYGIPTNPTLGQEANGLAHYGLDQAGVSPDRQTMIFKDVNVRSPEYRPFLDRFDQIHRHAVIGQSDVRQDG